MLVVTRYRVPADEWVSFHEQARGAVRVLTERPGCRAATVGRNVDEPELWTLTTEWATVGDYRRALSNAQVKQYAVPLMYRAVDEPTAYEALTTWNPADGVQEHVSDLGL
ncbi:antibiotic biosynthesis monooxygenase family protein [Spongisporangium articulatum]|uniref:Antibiotic biosynthesis monooxygenase family protein n=1 Tax=Spongisporangium articulatum TaxID=3362603 RepID=A0ABW8ALB0_9ACTN